MVHADLQADFIPGVSLMSGYSVGQGILLGICIGMFVYGSHRHDMSLRGSAVLLIVGATLVALASGINFLSDLVAWIPDRSLRDVFLYSGAPPGDVVIPVAYACIFLGAGGLVRRTILSVLSSAERR